jgi:hypothetical protein
MFVVIESTPGYLPETEPVDFEDYSEAVSYLNELADELEEQGYETDRSWASSDNLAAVHATRTDTVAPDLGRSIEIIRDQA